MDTLSFPSLASPRIHDYYGSEKPASSPTPFLSASSSPVRDEHAMFYFSAPTSPHRIPKTEMPILPTEWVPEWAGFTSSSWEEMRPDRRSETRSPSLTGSDFEFGAPLSEIEDPPLSPKLLSSTIPSNEQFFKGQISSPSPSPRQLQKPCSMRQLMAEELNQASNGNSLASSPRAPLTPLDHGQRNVISPGGVNENPRKVEGKSKSFSDKRTRYLLPLRVHHSDEVHHASGSPQREEMKREEMPSRDSSSVDEEPSKDAKGDSLKTSKKFHWAFKDLLRRSRGSKRDSLPVERQSAGSDLSIGNRSPQRFPGPVSPQRTPRPMSPHERHYKSHRAQTEELRKKTFLPYRQGLLGCLGGTIADMSEPKTLQSVW